MKSKTIKKILKEKIEDWAASVDNDEIKDIIKNNTIVTGGCIASMLLQSDVNDYDVYLDSKEACKKITEYYVGVANKELGASIKIVDGKDYEGFNYWGEDYSENEENHVEYESWQKYGVNGHQYARCVHNLDTSRIKLFMKDAGMYRVDALKLVSKDEDGNNIKKRYCPAFFSSNAISLTDDIQVIIRFHGNPEEIHKNYDFVHATNYYLYKGNELKLRKEALEALLTKELRYIGSKYPITSIIRARKFAARGFSIHAGTYLKMCYQVSKLDLDDLTVLEDQIAGVDVAYFDQLLNALRDKSIKDSGFKLDYTYLSHIIDKIFD